MYCRRVNTTSLDEVAAAIGPRTKLVWLESPTNPRQQISDIRVSSLFLQNLKPETKWTYFAVTFNWFYGWLVFVENIRDGSCSWCSCVGGQQYYVTGALSAIRTWSRCV